MQRKVVQSHFIPGSSSRQGSGIRDLRTPKLASDDPFKKPGDVSSAVRTLDFDESNEVTKKTRSKVSLKEVTLAELETQFNPPDITPDMYADVHSPDYTLKK